MNTMEAEKISNGDDKQENHVAEMLQRPSEGCPEKTKEKVMMDEENVKTGLTSIIITVKLAIHNPSILPAFVSNLLLLTTIFC